MGVCPSRPPASSTRTGRAAHGPTKKVQRGGIGSMNLSAGLNEHNARHCHLTFVCRCRGVIHGLAGYFESVLYRPHNKDKEPVELSTLPDQIDRKSKDMVSWFPIFFPLKVSARLVHVLSGPAS